MKSYLASNLDELDSVAKQILKDYNNISIFALKGDLGAGKTALVKAFAKCLAISDNVSSPTFSLINEYGNPTSVYHFDLYRLETQKEIVQIGFEDYIDSNKYCFIEWPEKITMLLPPDRSKMISIVMQSNDIRKLTIEDL
jgi:tRNA threonylcarbamoyladenosine biosynthesis protein TsaE